MRAIVLDTLPEHQLQFYGPRATELDDICSDVYVNIGPPSSEGTMFEPSRKVYVNTGLRIRALKMIKHALEMQPEGDWSDCAIVKGHNIGNHVLCKHKATDTTVRITYNLTVSRRNTLVRTLLDHNIDLAYIYYTLRFALMFPPPSSNTKNPADRWDIDPYTLLVLTEQALRLASFKRARNLGLGKMSSPSTPSSTWSLSEKFFIVLDFLTSYLHLHMPSSLFTLVNPFEIFKYSSKGSIERMVQEIEGRDQTDHDCLRELARICEQRRRLDKFSSPGFSKRREAYRRELCLQDPAWPMQDLGPGVQGLEEIMGRLSRFREDIVKRLRTKSLFSTQSKRQSGILLGIFDDTDLSKRLEERRELVEGFLSRGTLDQDSLAASSVSDPDNYRLR